MSKHNLRPPPHCKSATILLQPLTETSGIQLSANARNRNHAMSLPSATKMAETFKIQILILNSWGSVLYVGVDVR
jgi:hypothetical protein